MNWKRGLTRIYAVIWVLFALGGAALLLSLSSSSADDPSSIWAAWGWWAAACLVLPAVLLWIIKWIIAGFRSRNDAAKPPTAPMTPVSTPGPPSPIGSPKKQRWFRQNLWPRITDADSAKKAVNLGAGAAYWVAGLTTVFAVLGIFKIVKLLDASALVDAIAFAVVGFLMMKKMSRGAAVTGLAFYIIERVYMTATKGPSVGLGGIGVPLTLFFITGVRGAFAYHRFHEQPTDDLTTAKAA